MTCKCPLILQLLEGAFATLPKGHCIKSHRNTSKHVDTVIIFPNLNQNATCIQHRPAYIPAAVLEVVNQILFSIIFVKFNDDMYMKR